MARISSKNQITLPVAVLEQSGLKAGDIVNVEAQPDGSLTVRRAENWVDEFVGSVPPGTYPSGYLDQLRDEWER